MRMDQIRSTATNTARDQSVSTSTSTDLRDIASSEYGLEVTFKNKRMGLRTYDVSCNTDNWKPYTYSTGSNTEEVRKREIGIGDGKLDAFLCNFNDEEHMEETTEEVVYNQYMELTHGSDKTHEKGSIRKRRWTSEEALNESGSLSTDTTLAIPEPDPEPVTTRYEEQTTSFISRDKDFDKNDWLNGGMKEGSTEEGSSSSSHQKTFTVMNRLVGEPGTETVTTVTHTSGGGAGGGDNGLVRSSMVTNLRSELDALNDRKSSDDSGEEGGGESEEIITVKTLHGQSYYEKYVAGTRGDQHEDNNTGGN